MNRPRCDIYCRVSSTEQAQEGYSLGEQETRLRSFAAAQGWEIHACYVDPGYSGAKLDRPGIQAVIRDAEAHLVDRVVTYKLDRLSRSQKDTLFLIEDVFNKNGVGYVSMTESLDTSTPFGMAMIGILSVFAQLERAQIEERMMLGRIASAKEGNWRGGSGVPIGYRYIPKTQTAPGQLIVDEYEARIVRTVFEQFLTGKTYHAIYEFCRERYSTSYGRFGSGGSAIIPAMLSNRVYIGEIKYCGEWYPGKHQPIVDRGLFDRVQAAMVEYRGLLNEHKRKPFKAGHLLTGFLWCGECGARWCFHSCSYKTKNGETRSYDTYCCYTKNAHRGQRRADRCSIPVWGAADLEEIVLDQIRSLRYDSLDTRVPDEGSELAFYEGRISETDRKLERLTDLYLSGDIPMEILRKRSEDLKTEKAQLLELAEAVRGRMARCTPQELSDALARVDEILAGPESGKRELLTLLIRKITLGADRSVVIEWNI